MGIVVLTVAAIAIVMLIMAIGVIFKRPCLRGSCGGPEIFDADGEPISCGACPRRKRRESDVAPGVSACIGEAGAGGESCETEALLPNRR
jgi:hypothetical protein